MESPEFVDVQGLRALDALATLAWQDNAQSPKAWEVMCRAALEYRAAAYSAALQGFLWAEAWDEKTSASRTTQQRTLARNGIRLATLKVERALDALAAAEELVNSLA